MQTARLLRRLFILGLIAVASLRAAPADDAQAALVGGIDEVSAVLRAHPSQKDLITTLDTLVDKHFAFATPPASPSAPPGGISRRNNRQNSPLFSAAW
jgi:hypothetical protein